MTAPPASPPSQITPSMGTHTLWGWGGKAAIRRLRATIPQSWARQFQLHGPSPKVRVTITGSAGLLHYFLLFLRLLRVVVHPIPRQEVDSPPYLLAFQGKSGSPDAHFKRGLPGLEAFGGTPSRITTDRIRGGHFRYLAYQIARWNRSVAKSAPRCPTLLV